MRQLILTITILLTFNSTNAQESQCFENVQGSSYWPLKIGQELKYRSGNDSYVSKIKNDSVEFNGKYYLKEVKYYSSGKEKTSYWRNENGAIYNYNKEKKQESMELPTNPTSGLTWQSTDKTWTYEVVSMNSEFSTPYCNFDSLLEVETKSSERKGYVYNLYYKKGLGLVGLEVNGKPYLFIKPNEELNERNFMAYGCEHLESETKIQKCTYNKIYEHIQSNLNPPKNSKKGKIIFNVIIGRDGRVEEVKIVKGLKNAKKQEEEAINVLKSLPELIPAQIDDGQTVRSSFKVPINF